MMKLISAAALIAAATMGQTSGPPGVLMVTVDPTGTCSVGSLLQFNVNNGKLWGCANSAWGILGGGAGVFSYSSNVATYPSNSTTFLPVGGGAASNASESVVQSALPSGAAISKMQVHLSTGTGTSIVFTWMLNGSPTALTCTITFPGTTCADSTHSFTGSAGDLIDIQAVTSGTSSVIPTTTINTRVQI
jgi:hypothetical protein